MKKKRDKIQTFKKVKSRFENDTTFSYYHISV